MDSKLEALFQTSIDLLSAAITTELGRSFSELEMDQIAYEVLSKSPILPDLFYKTYFVSGYEWPFKDKTLSDEARQKIAHLQLVKRGKFLGGDLACFGSPIYVGTTPTVINWAVDTHKEYYKNESTTKDNVKKYLYSEERKQVRDESIAAWEKKLGDSAAQVETVAVAPISVKKKK